MPNTWITDDNGNRASVEYWGSEDAARKSLASLKECRNCTNCSGCSRCSGCSDCSECSRCSGCSGCYDCSGCYGLKDATPVEVQPSRKLEVPVIENLHQKLYAAVTATEESLDMSDVHACATTHCRAGWVVTLAGEAGKALESHFGWDLAAMKIYDASCPGYKISPCRFYDSDEDALADMKRLAEEEAARV